MNKFFSFSVFLKEAVFFIAVQLLGIYVVFKSMATPGDFRTETLTLKFSPLDISISVIFLILFILLLRHSGRASRLALKTFLGLAILSGCQIVLFSFFDPIIATLIAVTILILFLKLKYVIVHDLAIMAALAGIGAVIGLSLTPMVAAILIAIFSFYDILAVYKTGHMVVMAQGMIRAGAIFGLIIPTYGKDFFADTKDITPGDRFMVLGSGDIALPLALSGAVAKVSLPGALAVAVFATFGLFATHLIFTNQKERRPMAALPPIAAMTILGYLFYSLII